MAQVERVAIVGMAVRFPGSGPELSRFWSDVASATDRSCEVPDGRWYLPPDACFDPRVPHPDSVYSRRAYFLDPFDSDPTGWNVPVGLLSGLDPLFHLVLDVGHRAWAEAKNGNVDRRKGGVVLGNICLPTESSSTLAREYLGSKVADALGQPRESARTHPLNRYVAGLPAGLLAKSLSLGGGTYTLDAACASTLYAIKLACDELLAGRADLMLAGGSNRADPQYLQMGFAQLRALSPSGCCAPFDAEADGLMVGEGAGVFVLKRLSDALGDGDTIHGVVCGIGLSNDMRGNLLAPAKEGQLRAMRAAYERAGWIPTDADLIECHATGTPVGDAIEFDSLRELWGESGWSTGQCAIGSVKSTVGHLLTGAGTAALAKVLLGFAKGTLAPQANFTRPGVELRYEGGPFRVLREAEPWDVRRPGRPRRAAVSGFGFGGVNAHLLVEEYVGQKYFEVERVMVPASTPGTASIASAPGDDAIAIVGMAAHFGPWADLRTFQEYALGGGSNPEPRAKQNGWGLAVSECPAGYFIEELSTPLDRFRIPPKELEEMLPQQLLMLGVAAAALDDSRKPTTSDDDPRTGVFVGLGLDLNTTNFHLRWAAKKQSKGRETPDFLDAVSPALNANRVMGALGSIAASRIARAFHFGGPSFTVCSEETSAGRALELAVRALRSGDLDRALVGGVDLAGDPRALLATAADRPFVSDGVATPLGAGDGALGGDGAAAIILKRLADAERDGDRIYAVIRGVGSASGGVASGLAPDASAYASSLMRACADAVVDPASIEYIESAATGSAADDAPEAEALGALLTAQGRPWPVTVGAVRGQVGQVGAAGTLAGLVKAGLALFHQILPPGAIGEEPRSELATALNRIHRSRSPRFWLTDTDAGPRRAIVAGTGVDGSVVHIVLEEHATRTEPDDSQPLGARPEAVFAVEEDSPAELVAGLERLTAWVSSRADRPIEFLAREWLKQSPPAPGRARAVTLVARAGTEVLKLAELALDSIRLNPDLPLPGPSMAPGIRDCLFYAPNPLGSNGKLAFVFPGSGNHYPGLGQALGVNWPAIVRRQQNESQLLRSQYAPERFWSDAIPTDTSAKHLLFAQVTFGTLITDLLTSLGVAPAAQIGLSLGESSGMFGLRIWQDRDEMWRRIQTSSLFGKDLAPPFESAREFWGLWDEESVDWFAGVLAAPVDDVRLMLRPGGRAYILIVTTPEECVIGGQRHHIEDLVARTGAPFVPISGVTLSHCEVGRPVAAAYRALHVLPTTPPDGVAVYSAVWGRSYVPTPDGVADAITAGLVNPIDFPAVIEAAYRDGLRIFAEVGPGGSATRMISSILGHRPHLARAVTASIRGDELGSVLRFVANLVAERVPVDLTRLSGRISACADHREERSAKRVVTVPVGSPTRELPPILPGRPSQALPIREPAANGHAFHSPVPAADWAAGMAPFVSALAETQTVAAAAHDAYLRVQAGYTQTATMALQIQTELIRRLMTPGTAAAPATHPGPTSAAVTSEAGRQPTSEVDAVVPRSLDTAQCFEFASGKVGNVLGPHYAEIDSFPTRVRLPDGPLMLVDRIAAIEGEPLSLTRGRVVTEHTVRPDRWYLEAGRAPTAIAVESGQADLFLSGFLGIDFHTRGKAVYRLLDAVVEFHRGLPQVGETVRYDIHIDEFFHQSDTWLFRFHFDATVNGTPLMSMRNGVAGFFTPEQLAAGQGIVHTKLDRQPLPGKKPDDWPDLMPTGSDSFGPEQIEALRRGDLAAAFGAAFAPRSLRAPVKLPGGMLRLIDRVTRLDPAGGRYGLGLVRAEYDVRPDDWFLTCHFVDDMVMPGTLMYECCLHTLRVLLMWMGWVGEEGELAYEPVPGVTSRLKCRGQVIATTKIAAYAVSVKELGYGPEPYCIADALMYADGKPIVEMTNMSLRLTGMTKEKLEQLWTAAPAAAAPAPEQNYDIKPAVYDSASIRAFSSGNPSEAFGEPYRPFDRDRVIARLPGPPFQFIDRVTVVTGEPFVLVAGASCETQYDVPMDAWYFAANRCPRMPFSVLLEIALQPCGWLAAYCGSALAGGATDLKFRNLGGKATQFHPVGPDVGTLTVSAKMTNVSKSAGMIIQNFAMKIASRERVIYEGTTYFGFFAANALANQVGIPTATVPFLTEKEHDLAEFPMTSPFPDAMLRMLTRIDGYAPSGGRARLGVVQGSIDVNPGFWFFAAHFFQDPVWPGSLGVESFLQLLKYAAWMRWGDPPAAGWQTPAPGKQHDWVYRGQVVPTDNIVTVVLEVTAVDDEAQRITADGFLTVDGRVIYHLTGFTLE